MSSDHGPPPASAHPLCYGVALPHQGTLPVLGVAVSFRSNDPAILAAATDAFRQWERYDGPVEREDDPVRVDLVRHDVPEASGGGPATYRIPDRDRVLVVGPGRSLGISDALRRQVLMYVGASARPGFATGLVLSLLIHEDRFPVHAGAVGRGDGALLLQGPSGVGKSTLAFAFMEAGGTVLSDDSVFVQRRDPGGVWGAPGHLHLLPDAAGFFPVLQGTDPELLPNGKSKIRWPIATATAPDRFVYRRFGICLLRRSDTATPRLRRLSPEEMEAELLAAPLQRLDAFAEEAPRVLRSLAAHRPAWRLELGGRPQDAVAYVEAALDVLEGLDDGADPDP